MKKNSLIKTGMITNLVLIMTMFMPALANARGYFNDVNSESIEKLENSLELEMFPRIEQTKEKTRQLIAELEKIRNHDTKAYYDKKFEIVKSDLQTTNDYVYILEHKLWLRVDSAYLTLKAENDALKSDLANLKKEISEIKLRIK